MSRHSTPRTPNKKEDSRHESEESLNLENIRCEYHPNFKIDAISVNEKRSNLKLHCIKCIIDCKDFAAHEGDRMITIKELLQKSTEPQISNNEKSLQRREALQNTYLDFLTKNYSQKYEQHAEEQMKLVDSEITDLIHKLTKLRDRYKDYHASRIMDIDAKVDEVKVNIAKFLNEVQNAENGPLFTSDELAQNFSKITTKPELLDFLTNVYRSTRDGFESISGEERRTLELIEEIKNTFSVAKVTCVDMNKIKDVNRVVSFFLDKELHLYNSEKETGYQSNTIQTHSAQPFGLEHSRHMSDEKSYQSDEVSPGPSKMIKSEGNNSRVNFRSLDNISVNNNNGEKKSKRFRHIDIDSGVLSRITKTIENKDGPIAEDVKMKAIEKLNDWVNRRLTGYLLFQNTMNSNPLEMTEKDNYKDLGIHLNGITGQRWKNLSPEEREEYKSLAKEYRKVLRKEIEAYENYDDITELIEQFDQKIKKIKKE